MCELSRLRLLQQNIGGEGLPAGDAGAEESSGARGGSAR